MADVASASVFWMYSLMLVFASGALFFLYKAVKSGAVADDESPKYRMMGMLEEEGESHGE